LMIQWNANQAAEPSGSIVTCQFNDLRFGQISVEAGRDRPPGCDGA